MLNRITAFKTWYVYTYALPDGTVFYVGKGNHARIDAHEREARKGCDCEKCRIIRQIWESGHPIQKRIVLETLVEAEALVQERSLIDRYAGPQLTNIRGNVKKLARAAKAKQEERADPDQMLSANQAGKLLGISGKTVIRMMEAGEFPGYRIGIAWKFRRGDIEAYRASRRYQPDRDDED